MSEADAGGYKSMKLFDAAKKNRRVSTLGYLAHMGTTAPMGHARKSTLSMRLSSAKMGSARMNGRESLAKNSQTTPMNRAAR